MTLKTSLQINNEFKSKAIDPVGSLIFDKKTALELVEVLWLNGINIVGVDAFFVTTNTIQPNSRESCDFSGDNFEISHAKTNSFFKSETLKSTHFEVVFGGSDFHLRRGDWTKVD